MSFLCVCLYIISSDTHICTVSYCCFCNDCAPFLLWSEEEICGQWFLDPGDESFVWDQICFNELVLRDICYILFSFTLEPNVNGNHVREETCTPICPNPRTQGEHSTFSTCQWLQCSCCMKGSFSVDGKGGKHIQQHLTLPRVSPTFIYKYLAYLHKNRTRISLRFPAKKSLHSR